MTEPRRGQLFGRRPGTGPAPVPIASTSPIVSWGWYVDGERQDCSDLAFATSHAKVGDGWIWLGLKEPDYEEMSGFARSFDLHPLAIEDAVEGHTRSKIEVFDETLFAVISTVAYVDHETLTESSEIVSTGQIMVFVGPGFVMTVRRGEQAPLANLRSRLEGDQELLREGPIVVLYGVMDKIIDDYVGVVAAFEDDIDEAEAAVFSRTGSKEINRVYQLKRELIEFKRAVAPLGTPLLQLMTRPLPSVPESMQAYFRELHDHHAEARESIQSFDDILTTILSAGLARASVEDNQDMRKISAFVAILAVPTLIGAVYGMNFQNMPELSWQFGYPFAWGLIIVGMLVMYLIFKAKRWL